MNARFKFGLGVAAVAVALVGQFATRNRVAVEPVKEQRDPYAWTMACDYWETRSLEILQDENIPMSQRIALIAHFRTKVKEDCKTPRDLLANL